MAFSDSDGGLAGAGGGGGPATQSGAWSVATTGKAISLLSVGTGSINGTAVSGAKNVQRVKGRNVTTTSYYLMLFDGTSAPTNGATPAMICFVGYGNAGYATEGTEELSDNYASFVHNVYYAWSTTDATLTLAASGTGLTYEVWG